MKKLILMRHAEAINATVEMEDFNRPLSENGIKQAQQRQIDFSKTEIQPELILVSNAVRTTQTAKIFTKSTPCPNIQFLPNLYLCDIIELQNIIASVNNNISTLMIIAHNPSLHEFAYHLSAQPEMLTHDFSTSSIAIFAWRSDDWQNCAAHSNKILHFITPNTP